MSIYLFKKCRYVSFVAKQVVIVAALNTWQNFDPTYTWISAWLSFNTAHLLQRLKKMFTKYFPQNCLFGRVLYSKVSVVLKCIWHEISHFLKWKNSLSCSVTYFSVSCFYALFPRYFNLICKWVWICPLIYDVTLVASSTYTGYKCINSKNCRYQFTFFSSILSHLPASEVRNYYLGW
jgi:hypothetical protein